MERWKKNATRSTLCHFSDCTSLHVFVSSPLPFHDRRGAAAPHPLAVLFLNDTMHTGAIPKAPAQVHAGASAVD